MVSFCNGLTIKRNLDWIPQIGIDDNGKYITVRQAIDGTHIDQSTVRRAILRGEIKGQKIKGRFHLRLASYTRWVIGRYKYTKKAAFDGRNGRWWRKLELKLIYSKMPICEIMEKTGRSYRAVVVHEPGRDWPVVATIKEVKQCHGFG